MAKDIGSVDKNLKIETTLQENDLRMYNVRSEPFRIHGLYRPENEGPFRRIPSALAKDVNQEVFEHMHYCTAGARVHFRTNSKYVAIKAIYYLQSLTREGHIALSGSAGFDLYERTPSSIEYRGTFIPPTDAEGGYESIIYFDDCRERDLIINLPLYCGVAELYVGLQETATLSAGSGYRYGVPVLYYGSSITQGLGASRPGNAYQAIISRRWDCDFINLGFAGSAFGEESIMEYMAQLDFSIFVMDYDHNAPNPEHLLDTHKRGYEIIRRHHPEAPIIMVTRPDFYSERQTDAERRSVVFHTYMGAVHAGDRNVYYIDGCSLLGCEYRDTCTVDGCHPSDLGYCRMADTIGTLVGRLLR